MPAPTIPAPLDALLLALREAIAPALAGREPVTNPCGWPADDWIMDTSEDTKHAAVEAWRKGRAALAADVAALLDAALSEVLP